MTRRVIVQELMSVDGYVADESGGVDFFDAVADFDEGDRDNLVMMSAVRTIVLGRVTHEPPLGDVVGRWPTHHLGLAVAPRRPFEGRGEDDLATRTWPTPSTPGPHRLHHQRSLRLLEAKPYESGIVAPRYRIGGSSG